MLVPVFQSVGSRDYCIVVCVSELALSPNNHEVHIYQMRGGQWSKIATLDEHVQRVTGIDWAPQTNTIVTCGAVSFQMILVVIIKKQQEKNAIISK